jgi:UDP-N-acetylglucosamine--N-acetylmuramyl-(pentapeptide) pyrophosphoryl-undecaprenol N-acetylglucosamine transferase
VRLLRRFDPQIVMGVGAYVSGTLLLAAALKGIPTLILEPNAEPGLANRWLAPFVDEAACAWDETTRYFGTKGFVTGNPVRRGIVEVGPLGPQTSQRMRVLVFGGSQGSAALNRAIAGSLSILSPALDRLEWVHQTGPRDFASVSEAYARHSIRAEVVPYIDKMHEAYEAADLVIARAGPPLARLRRAGTLLPTARRGHQESIEMMTNAGAAVICAKAIYGPESHAVGSSERSRGARAWRGARSTRAAERRPPAASSQGSPGGGVSASLLEDECISSGSVSG